MMRSLLLAGLCVFGWLMFTPSEIQAQSRSSRDVVIRGGDRGRDGDIRIIRRQRDRDIRVIRDRRGRLIVLDDRFRNDDNSDDDSSDDGRSNRRRFGNRRYPLDRGYYRGGQVLFERNGVAVLVDRQGNLVLGLPRRF